MKQKSFYLKVIVFLPLFLALIYFFIDWRINFLVARHWLVPLDTENRKDWDSLLIKEGSDKYLAPRMAYRGMKAHLHTGVDLQNKKPPANYKSEGEPVYAVAKGIVHDIRKGRGGTRVTIRHLLANGEIVYSNYIHVMDIKVKRGRLVNSRVQIARLFNQAELKKYGKIYDHLHFEVLKDKFVPQHTISSFSKAQVRKRSYNPEEIFYHHHQEEKADWIKWLKEGRISLWEFLKWLL